MSAKAMAIAIMTWFAAQHSSWWECGRRYTPEEAEQRALEYAKIIKTTVKNTPSATDLDEYWILGMLAQESALDRCQLARSMKRSLGLPRRPSESQVLQVLKRLRKLHRRADTGPLQRKFPPYGAHYQPERALDLAFQIKLTAQRFPQYLKICRANYGARKAWKLKRRRGRLTCEDLYFTLHNTGGLSINLKYYRSVSFQLRRMQISANSLTRKEDSCS